MLLVLLAVVSVDYRLCPETPLPDLVADVCDGMTDLPIAMSQLHALAYTRP